MDISSKIIRQQAKSSLHSKYSFTVAVYPNVSVGGHIWFKARGWFGDITAGDVQFDYEITSSNGGMNFVTNSYSVSFN